MTFNFSRMRQLYWVVGWVSLAGAIAACGGASRGHAEGPEAPPPNAPNVTAEISRVHRSRCGSCHMRVEPGERNREQLEAAFVRHRKRVHLSEEQWGEMIEYLAVR